MAKIRKENSAMQTQSQNVNNMTTEQLALLLNQSYSMLIQAKDNIQLINAELQNRQQSKESAKNDGHGNSNPG